MAESLSPVIRAVLLTDIVGSTSIVERLGDSKASELLGLTDRIARDLMVEHHGREIDKSDGYLIVFERPIDAVRWALEYHNRLREISAEAGESVTTRVGIHLGEVILKENTPEDVARGAKMTEVTGIALPIAARMMSLARGGQTLLTRSAFDLARRAAVGSSGVPVATEWLAHGPYLVRGVEEPVEVFEAGVRGSAPLLPPEDSEKAHRAVAAEDEVTLGWRPAPEREVEGRANWVLKEKLGEGGFGEVWLVEHKKTRDKRVYKFCFQADRLRGLKREVVLFRLLKETLGDRDDIARVLDWNFETPPFFIESEFTEGGDLIDWAAAQGGIAAVPLNVRLKIMAQVAEALAAAHSVGVLHKDIKPSNILITTDSEGAPKARLTDFGIGLVTDRALLAEQGITATGLSETYSADNPTSSRSGTRMYMAPELLEGKPTTIQADIYSLGIMLYQVVVGDLRRALGVGWERDVADPILRADIEQCVDRDTHLRLGGATELAVRLRTLEKRRAAIAEEARRRKEAEESLASLERARQRRRLATFAATAATIVLAVTALLYRDSLKQRQRAEEAEEQTAIRAADAERALARAEISRGETEELVSFMLEELTTNLFPIGRLDVMDSVLSKVEALLSKRTDTSLSVAERWSLINLLQQIASVRLAQGNISAADAAAKRALRESEAAAAEDPKSARWKRAVAMSLQAVGNTIEATGDFQAAHDSFELAYERIMTMQPATQDERIIWLRDQNNVMDRLMSMNSQMGNASKALEFANRCLDNLQEIKAVDPDSEDTNRDIAVTWRSLGIAHSQLGDFKSADSAYRESLRVLGEMTAKEPDNLLWQEDLALVWNSMGDLLSLQWKAEEAREAYTESHAILDRLALSDPSNLRVLRMLSVSLNRLGSISWTTGRKEETEAAYRESTAISERLALLDPTNAQWRNDLAHTYVVLGDFHLSESRIADARVAFEKALEIHNQLAIDQPDNVSWRVGLSRSEDRIGGLEEKDGKLDAALAAYERSLALLQRIVETSSDVEVRRLHGYAWFRIGGALESQDKFVEAIAAFQAGLESANLVAEKDAENPTSVRDLWNYWDRIAKLQIKLESWSDARLALHQTIELAGKRAASDPDPVPWRIYQSTAYAQIAETFATEGDANAAADSLATSRRVLKELATEFPKDERVRKAIESAEAAATESGG